MKMNRPAQPNRRRPGHKGGFTLVELMLAMGVCAIALA
ncbi:MAG: type II secretion system protein, partial [Verrucomicrobiia bacterium]